MESGILLPVEPDEERHHAPLADELQRCLRQHGAVHRRADVEVAGSLDQLRRRRGAQAREDVCRCVATSRPQHVEPERFAIDKRVEPTGERPYRLALYRRGRDQAARPRRGHDRDRVEGAGRAAEERHARGVAAERVDVLVDPLQRSYLVEEAVGARRPAALGGERRMRDKAEDAESVADGHDDHAARGERVCLGVGVAGAVASRMEVHHHRQVRRTRSRRRDEHVQVQAVFGAERSTVREVELDARRREGSRVAHAGPWGDGGGRAPPQGPYGRSGVGDPTPLLHGALHDAADGAVRRRHHERR